MSEHPHTRGFLSYHLSSSLSFQQLTEIRPNRHHLERLAGLLTDVTVTVFVKAPATAVNYFFLCPSCSLIDAIIFPVSL